MLKLFLTICLICLCACSKQPEKESRSVTRKPAQLEVKWTQVYDIGDPTRNKTTISPEIEAKLLKLGPYQSQYTINIRSDGSIISFRVIYLDEIKHDQADVVLPLIRETLAPAKFEVIFHPAEVTEKIKITETNLKPH